ncbi:MAG: helix-turn-helix domain-containing protein, partial [Patescibacteria group bacterium]
MLDVNNLLKKFGLTEKEASVFLALFKFGKMSASEVASVSGVGRTNVYHIAPDLKKKNLIYEIKEGRTRKFIAVDYNRLVSLADDKAEEWREIKNELANAESQFTSLLFGNFKTKLVSLASAESAEKIINEIKTDLENTEPTSAGLKNDLFVFYSYEKFIKIFPVWNSVAFNASKKEIICGAPENILPNSEIKLWPKEKGDLPAAFILWKGKAVIIDCKTGPPAGIKVENSAVAETLKIWFYEIWKGLG